MRWKALPRVDAIFIDHSQRAKVLEGGVVVIGKGECVKGLWVSMSPIILLAGVACLNPF